MNRSFSFKFIFIIAFLLIISCGNKKPIPEEIFVKIYSDMTIMQDTSTLSQKHIREKVLTKYYYLEPDYIRTINYYNSNQDEWTRFFDKTVEYIESLKTKATKTEPLVLPRRFVLKDM